MKVADSILAEKAIKTDDCMRVICEFYAEKVKYHSTHIEYIFKDESTIIQGI